MFRPRGYPARTRIGPHDPPRPAKGPARDAPAQPDPARRRRDLEEAVVSASAVQLAELALSRAWLALATAERTCRYHGTDFERSGMWLGLPRCDSCKQPYRVTAALADVERAQAALERER